MNKAQMIAWLIIEGWVFYKGSGDDEVAEVADGARKGDIGLVVLTDNSVSKHKLPPETNAWPDSDIRPWEEATRGRVKLFYEYIVGETS